MPEFKDILLRGTSKFNLPPSGHMFDFYTRLNSDTPLRKQKAYAYITPLLTNAIPFLGHTLRVTTRQEWEESVSKRQNGLCQFKQDGNKKREEKSITT